MQGYGSFVTSERILSIIAIAKLYECRPSEVFPEMDEYTAFCFDEACSYIQIMMQNEDNNKPHFKVKDDDTPKASHFKSAKDLYSSMGYDNGAYKKTI